MVELFLHPCFLIFFGCFPDLLVELLFFLCVVVFLGFVALLNECEGGVSDPWLLGFFGIEWYVCFHAVEKVVFECLPLLVHCDLCVVVLHWCCDVGPQLSVCGDGGRRGDWTGLREEVEIEELLGCCGWFSGR